MIKSFAHKGLKDFYETGSKKGIQPEHASKLARMLDRLDASTSAQDMNLPGYRLHPLKGDKKDMWSVTVNGNWRMTFYFEDGDVFSIGEAKNAQLQVIHTPGHTTDSVVFYDYKNGIAFSGDTIFKNSVGAVHFPGGNARQLADSIFTRIFVLPEETLLYSGHSDVTSVGAEKKRYE